MYCYLPRALGYPVISTSGLRTAPVSRPHCTSSPMATTSTWPLRSTSCVRDCLTRPTWREWVGGICSASRVSPSTQQPCVTSILDRYVSYSVAWVYRSVTKNRGSINDLFLILKSLYTCTSILRSLKNFHVILLFAGSDYVVKNVHVVFFILLSLPSSPNSFTDLAWD